MNLTDIIPSRFPSRYALARALGIRPSAVYAWKDGELPLLRAYQVRELVQNATVTVPASVGDTIHAPDNT